MYTIILFIKYDGLHVQHESFCWLGWESELNIKSCMPR